MPRTIFYKGLQLIDDLRGLWGGNFINDNFKIIADGLTDIAGATVSRITFSTGTWLSNNIVIIQTGISGAGQIGPHNLNISPSYIVQVYRISDNQLIEVNTTVDPVTGNITLTKTGLAPTFDGRVLIFG